MNKVITAEEAVRRTLADGITLMVGGFGLVGCPLTLVTAINESPIKDLTVVSNNLPWAGVYLGKTLLLRKVKRAIGSYFTSNPDVVRAHQEGWLDVTLVPQGTFAEAIRAAGAGLGGFYTPTSAGTVLAEGKETREIGGKQYVFEAPLSADVAFIRGHKADRLGNLTYYKTARNFNPAMATAAKKVVAEVDEIVDVGELDPEHIVTSHVYVDYLVLAKEHL